MEIRRFGPGHRRPDGPPGSKGVTGQVIHDGEEAIIAELAFGRYAMVAPHSNPNLCLLLVISGGGFVQVGDERARVNHGEAVVWPPDVPHGAYTDGSEMRAIVVELHQEAPAGDILEGVASRLLRSGELPESPGGGRAIYGARDDQERRGAVDADAGAQDTSEGSGRRQAAGDRGRTRAPSTRADGRLAERTPGRDEYDTSTGEPW